jgi:phenylalanyl-tRNA synthetase alpha chain
MSDLENIEHEISVGLADVRDVPELEALRVRYLGKTGVISTMLKSLGGMSPDDRRSYGPLINGLRDRAAAAIAARREVVETLALDAELAAGALDLSLPAPPSRTGCVHPIMQTMDEMIAVFAEMGFSLAEGPDIEDDFHNFTALNFPPKHPAREMHDTFFFRPGPGGERKLLRTHTSPVQVRTMRQGNTPPPAPWIASGQTPPIRIISPGRTYRCDSDATHTPMFHQIEGLVIDRGIHMGHLKWTVDQFIARFFELPSVVTRFRPHHFPFTEPSAEMDVQCDTSGGEVKVGVGHEWSEIVGCGVDRLARLKYGMPDLRDMFASDTRWLAHYGFSAFQAPNAASGLS